MKFLIVMRGHCNRNENIQYIYDNYLLKIKNPLLNNGHTVDCMFNTYNGYNEYFEKFKKLYNPIKIFRSNEFQPNKYENIAPNCGFQILNFYDGMTNIKSFINDYDKIIFLRFDICYKINIMKWNIFNDKGIFFTFKEDSLETYKKLDGVGDTIIIIDNEYFNNVHDCIYEYVQYYWFGNKIVEKIPPEHDSKTHLHWLKTCLLEKYGTLPIHYIIDGYYQSVTFFNSYMTLDKLNPLYIIFGKGKNYYGDMNDFILLERL